MPDLYAVFGNPIGHSKSPAIHMLFAEQTGQDISYEAQLIAIDNFDNAVKNFCTNGGKGLNITVPFKQAAFDIATKLSPRAEKAGAVNTLVLHGIDDYYGDNTDGIGLCRDLIRNHSIILSGKSILILGAGGAVRGVLEPIIGNKPSKLVIANRTVDKAIDLANLYEDGDKVTGCGFDDLKHQHFDVIINATSASLQGDMPPVPPSVIDKNSFCYDMMYAKEPTVFMQWARNHGTEQVTDGLGMLVEQAAESFSIWRGIDPKTQPVIEAIRAQL